MNGICPCGGMIKEREHLVKTDAGFSIWLMPLEKSGSFIPKGPPAIIVQSECVACGRYQVEARAVREPQHMDLFA